MGFLLYRTRPMIIGPVNAFQMLADALQTDYLDANFATICHAPESQVADFLYPIRFSISLVIYYYVDFPQIIVIYFGHVLTSRMPWFYHIVPMKFGTCVQQILKFVIDWSMNHLSIWKLKGNTMKNKHLLYHIYFPQFIKDILSMIKYADNITMTS